MLARTGRDPATFRRGSAMGDIMGRHGVPDSPELGRILRIPRRPPVWSEEAADLLTEGLRAPGGAMRLRPIQAAALVELHDFGGLLAIIQVGGGKTLISLLAAVVLGATRPVLLLPARLREKTLRDIEALQKHWTFPVPVILSYDILGRADHAGDLEALAPDLIVADEVHRLKNHQAAVTRRVKRYLHENPGTRFAGMSGTIARKSLRDFSHLAAWALGTLSPLPRPYPEVEAWAKALDPSVDDRLAVGALARLGGDGTLEGTRLAFRSRLHETPGVVSSPAGQGCPASIRIRPHRPHAPEIRAALASLEAVWETPGGEPISEAAVLYEKARQLAQGFYYRWKVPPPRAWIDARRAWCGFVRDRLAHPGGRPLDSELQVLRAYPEAEEATAWVAVRDTFEPENEAQWFSTAALEFAADWLAEDGGGIVWVKHIAFGEALASYSGRPYHRDKGLDSAGRHIEVAPDDRVIASIDTCSEGCNLQRWARNLVMAPPAMAAIWEQLIGRTHRPGQEADEILVEVLDHGGALVRALQGAIFARDATGQEQKLLIADIEGPEGRKD